MVTAACRAQPGTMTTFGLHLTSYPDAVGSIASYTQDVASAAENSGVFDALWLTDHVQTPHPAAPAAPLPEAHLVLAAVAACTRQIELGLLAASGGVSESGAAGQDDHHARPAVRRPRHPRDRREELPRTQAEAESYGFPFPPVRARMEMLDHALKVIRPMLGARAASGACRPAGRGRCAPVASRCARGRQRRAAPAPHRSQARRHDQPVTAVRRQPRPHPAQARRPASALRDRQPRPRTRSR